MVFSYSNYDLPLFISQPLDSPQFLLLVIILLSFFSLVLTIFLITKLLKVQKFQKKQQQNFLKFHLVVEHSPNSVIITDPDGIIEYTNKRFSQLTGFQCNELKGEKYQLLEHDEVEPSTYEMIKATVKQGKRWHGELLSYNKSQASFWAKTSIFPVISEHGEVIHLICIQEDITKQKQAQEHIKHLANHDELTGLPSLRLGRDRLHQAILSAQRHNLIMALMFIDLDGIKTVNDTYGHAAGDTVLKIISARIKDILRITDTIARIGGDEFIAILTNMKTSDVIDKIATKLINAINEPIIYQKHSLIVSASIGIALSPEHGTDSAVLLKKADQAMYQVKMSGKGNFCYYHETLD